MKIYIITKRKIESQGNNLEKIFRRNQKIVPKGERFYLLFMGQFILCIFIKPSYTLSFILWQAGNHNGNVLTWK